MKIPLDRQSQQPIYLQIRDRISHLITAGALQPGMQLPSIRMLAETVQVNKLTVIEAYNVLEADGLIHARQGAGYFVNTGTRLTPRLDPSFAPSQTVVIQEQPGTTFSELYLASVRALHQQDWLDLSCGFPNPPVDLRQVSRRAISDVAETLFNYDLPQGQATLRKQIALMLIQQGLELSPDDLIITNGSKQALSLAMHYYLKPGDWVVVESPSYHGGLAILSHLGVRVIGIPMTHEGMNLDLLEQYLKSHRPRLIYTISTLHNPTGVTSSLAHRQRLVALAHQYECPILEDNAYEGLSFEPAPPPIKAIDQYGWVTYIGTFSKTLMPGLRVGYMVPAKPHYSALLEQKLLHDLHASTVSQAIVSEYLASGHYRRHLNALRSTHLHSRNVMLQAMEQHFPEGMEWTVPQGGLFLWVKLPQTLPLQALYQDLAAQRLLVGNGAAFFPGRSAYPAMRLSFIRSPEEIERGIAILGQRLKHHLMASSSPVLS
ncbi:MAG: PLP-dependent aminotransferase family protein [Leptolyngbyaceae cyanobacterium bins.59]|nr:PLP-dependent aminotransferase family protein [Leptolyngbyaceae cyanobacterium bins.59]